MQRKPNVHPQLEAIQLLEPDCRAFRSTGNDWDRMAPRKLEKVRLRDAGPDFNRVGR